MAVVRKKLQKLGNSRVLIIDKNLLQILIPDGDLSQNLIVEVVGDALLVRREISEPPTLADLTTPAKERPPAVSLNRLDRSLLLAVSEGPVTTGGLTERVNRNQQHLSTVLNRLKRAGLLAKAGRDWSVTPAGAARLAEMGPATPSAMDRLVAALEAGPATAAELEERLGVTRGAVLMATKRALEAGVISRSGGPMPVYQLADR